MKITKLYFERIHNLGNYENEKFGAECELAPDENPDKVFEALKHFVEKNLFE
jgi:hypothetical protein